MILTDRINKYFSGVHAVEDVSLEVRRGEIFGLLGPNGAGKSTTIRMIVDIIRPDSGTITFDGRSVDEDIRARIGYLPEERGLYQKARILETILYFGRLKGLDRTVAEERSRAWLERFGLADAADRKIEELSKGNQQKVQIIIALLHEPDYLILDEPTSGLDPVNQGLLQEIVTDLRGRGVAILYSTHQMDLAERLCDRIGLINDGKIVLDGPVEEVRSRYSGNTVLLESNGDLSFLSSAPGVRSLRIDGTRADIELEEGLGLNYLFGLIADRVPVSRIEPVRPSLNTIFLTVVGRPPRRSRFRSEEHDPVAGIDTNPTDRGSENDGGTP